MSYKVRIDSFEGPFDLLVYLIETAEMSIYDIKISQITNQYLEYMQAMKERDVFVSTEFMVRRPHVTYGICRERKTASMF